jgi:hypothetical protein
MDSYIALFFIIVLSLASLYIATNIRNLTDILIIILFISVVVFINTYLY